MKKVLLMLWLSFSLFGCRSSRDISTNQSLENEKIVILVHGLNSGSSTWGKMTSMLSKKLGVSDGSSVEIGLEIDIKIGTMCWDASHDAKLISCSELSKIKEQEFFRKEELQKGQAPEHIFGLDRGQFIITAIPWKLKAESSDNMIVNDDQKRRRFLDQRVFSINFSNNNQLTYKAQGFQLAKVIENIQKLTGIKKVILIGHSMGGLASRAYIQNEKSVDVLKLITIDTPHLGGKTFAHLGAGSYLAGKNASVNLAGDSKALATLNDMESVAGKYDMIEVYHLGYSDGLNGLDILDRGSYYDEGDGIVDIGSQMGLDALNPYRVIFSPSIKSKIQAYKDLMTGEIKDADEVIESAKDYGILDRSISFTIAHTNVLSDEAYLNYIINLIEEN